jgi:RNA polymerase sigma-70 factor (ECF subfamily)
MSLFPLPHLNKQSSLEQPEDFARFYEQAHLNIFRYVMVLCAGDQDEAGDITAEAFLRAWDNRRQFSGSQKAALGWVIAIARDILIDRRRHESVSPLEISLEDTLTDGSDGVETTMVVDERLRLVVEAMQSLPLPQRDMVTLRYVLGWRVKTIAAHLGMAENTVSVDLRRALAKVQAQLARQGVNSGRTAPDET